MVMLGGEYPLVIEHEFVLITAARRSQAISRSITPATRTFHDSYVSFTSRAGRLNLPPALRILHEEGPSEIAIWDEIIFWCDKGVIGVGAVRASPNSAVVSERPPVCPRVPVQHVW